MPSSTSTDHTAASGYSEFLDEAIMRAGGNELSPDLRAVMKQQLMLEIEKRLRAETLAALTPEQFDEYAKEIADKPLGFADQVALFEHIIPNYHALLERAMREAAEEFVKISNS